jgi:hypothetical protein
MRKKEKHYANRVGWLRAAVLGANDGWSGYLVWQPKQHELSRLPSCLNRALSGNHGAN